MASGINIISCTTKLFVSILLTSLLNKICLEKDGKDNIVDTQLKNFMSVNYRCQLRFKTFSVNLIETERKNFRCCSL